jgi:hypothetical protein
MGNIDFAILNPPKRPKKRRNYVLFISTITSMKKLLLICFATVLTHATYAQWDGKGQMNLDLGIGVVSTLGIGGGIPLRASFDYGVFDNISLGIYLGYISVGEKYNYGNGVNGKWRYSYSIVGLRGAYHLPLFDDFDTYGGVLVSYYAASVKWDGTGTVTPITVKGGFAPSLYIGAKYMFQENIGAFAELGYGISIIQAGITFRLK